MVFLDADDWLAPDALSRLSAALEASPDAVAASGPCSFADTGAACSPPCGDLCRTCWCAIYLPIAGNCCCASRQSTRPAASCQVSPMARTGSSAFELRWKARSLARRQGSGVVRSPTRRRRVSAPRAERGRVRTLHECDIQSSGAFGSVWSARIGGDPPAYRGREHLDRRPRAGPPRLPCTWPRVAAPLGLRPSYRKARDAAGRRLPASPAADKLERAAQAVSRLRDFVASRRSAMSPASTIPTTVAGT